MPGQAVVTINNKEWQVGVATDPWELTQGLGGIPEMPPSSGMLFDLGYTQTIQVTTVPMLFSLDIVFLSEGLVVTEVYLDVQPGYLVTSTVPARYFIEVNAEEFQDIKLGEQAVVELLASQVMPNAETDLFTNLAVFLGSMILGVVVVSSAKDIIQGAVLTPISSPAKELPEKSTCDIVMPSDYSLLSWVGSPVPDYSFSIEPETKERRVDQILQKLKEGVVSIQESSAFRTFLLTMSKFHDYSIGNVILIMLQKPDATNVAGFTTWKDLGRWVKKGEKGIAILAPCFPPKEKRPASEEKNEEENNEETSVELKPAYFKVVHVFDVSQTEGKPLPEFEVPVLTGEANTELFDKVLTLARDQGVDVSFDSKLTQDPAIKGYYSGKSIWVRPEEAPAQQLKTLIHEVAHYYTEGVFHIPRRDAETIAESVAFTVGAHFGFDTGTRSFSYVALWAQDKKVLEQNLAAIRKVSTSIIDSLEKAMTRLVV